MMSEVPSSVPETLLERLVLLCHASQGAIFLVTSDPSGSGAISPSLTLDGRTPRPLATYKMSEEEMQLLLTPFSTDCPLTSPSPSDSCWLHWCLPLMLSLPTRQDEGRGSHRQENISSTLSALMLLGWEAHDDVSRNADIQKASLVLPSLADAVALVLVRILSDRTPSERETHGDQKALCKGNSLQAELLATVSHELRSPLASIKGYAATLLHHDRRISREERHEFLLAIHAASDRLAQVIASLLEMSELKTGDIDLKRTSVDIVHLVREVVMMLEQRAQGSAETLRGTKALSSHPSFVVRLDHHLEELAQDSLLLEADRGRLRQVFDHLLQNAVLYTSEGGLVEVKLRLVLSPTDVQQFRQESRETVSNMTQAQHRFGQIVVISVHDTGKGIAKHHLSRIFEPFYQVDTRLTRETGGLGLGLAICQYLIDLHNGMLWAESEVGKGSTFYVCLPYSDHTHLEENSIVHMEAGCERRNA